MALKIRCKRIPDSFWQRAENFPPILCRLLARENHGGHPAPMTDEAIASRSGLTIYRVNAISNSLSWADVELHAMRQFLIACELDFCDAKQMKRLTMYMRRGRLAYLRRSPNWTTQFEPLLQRWHRHCALPLISSIK